MSTEGRERGLSRVGISQLANIRKRVWAGAGAGSGAGAGERQLYQLFRNSILAADRGAFLDAGKWNNSCVFLFD